MAKETTYYGPATLRVELFWNTDGGSAWDSRGTFDLTLKDGEWKTLADVQRMAVDNLWRPRIGSNAWPSVNVSIIGGRIDQETPKEYCCKTLKGMLSMPPDEDDPVVMVVGEQLTLLGRNSAGYNIDYCPWCGKKWEKR